MAIKIVDWKVVQGNEKVSHEPIKILFSGSVSDFAYISKKVFGGSFSVVSDGKMPLSLFLLAARRNYFGCDLFLFQYKRSSSIRLRDSEYCLPLWIGSTVSLPMRVKSNSAKSDIRLIKKNGLVYSVSDARECIEDFFVNYWAPTIKKRYPEKNIQKERESWSKYRCEVLFVNDGQHDYSAALIRYDDDRPYLWRNGLKNGDLSLWNKGAIAATYYYAAEHLCSMGYDSLYLGLSRAFFSDGVFQYKKKWDGVVNGIDRYAFGLGVLKDRVGVRKFLINNPFFSFHNNGLYLTVFYEDVNVFEKEEYDINGLDGVRCVDINALSFC